MVKQFKCWKHHLKLLFKGVDPTGIKQDSNIFWKLAIASKNKHIWYTCLTHAWINRKNMQFYRRVSNGKTFFTEVSYKKMLFQSLGVQY